MITTLQLRLAGTSQPATAFSSLYAIASRSSVQSSTSTTRIACLRPQRPLQFTPCRNVSTSTPKTPPVEVAPFTTPTSTTATTIPLPSTPAASATPPSSALTWNTFLRLRKIRRYYNLSSSIGCAVATTFVGMSLLAQQNIQALGQQFFGLDPMVVIGVWTVGSAGIGWLLGPLVGSALFRMVHRSSVVEMAAKEKDFFTRIRKYRVDPTTSSMQNPVPDYYGEKITSVLGYRNWLRDQRAFNKKRQSPV